jgi:hypothetical protein
VDRVSRILITGARAPVALDLSRALRMQGHEVWGADVFRTALFGEGLTYAAPRHDPKGFEKDATGLLKRLKPDLVIPLCEEIYHWAKVPECPLFAPDVDTLMRLHSKYEFTQLAAGLGLNVPRTERTMQWAPESVFKPEFSRFGVRVLIRPAHGPSGDDRYNPWIRQAYIDGEDVCFYAIARGGRLRAFSAYRSAWRTKGGASYYFDPLDPALSARLQTVGATLAGALGLTGQIACDLRLDKAGDLWLLECNPRATSGLHLLAHDAAGLSAAFTGKGDMLTATTGAVCLGLAMQVYGWPRAMQTGHLRQWRQDMARARNVLKGNTAVALLDSMGFFWQATVRGQGLAEFLTGDIECNHRLS